MFADERVHGKPVYFCDVIVRRSSSARSFWDLKGGIWAYNDPCSLSGHGGLAARLGSQEAIGTFFRRMIRSGSHPASVRLVADGGADVASIDSNVLRILLEQTPTLQEKVRVLESWGPYPIQPVVVRTELDPALKVALRESLLKGTSRPAHPAGTRGVRAEAVRRSRRGGLRRRTTSAAVTRTLRSDPRRPYAPKCVE